MVFAIHRHESAMDFAGILKCRCPPGSPRLSPLHSSSLGHPTRPPEKGHIRNPCSVRPLPGAEPETMPSPAEVSNRLKIQQPEWPEAFCKSTPVLKYFSFNWKIVALQCGIGVCHIPVCMIYGYTCVYTCPLPSGPPSHPLGCHRAPG